MLSACLLMVHDTRCCGHDNVAELPRWQEVGGPLLNVLQLNIEARADDAALQRTKTSWHGEKVLGSNIIWISAGA